MDIAYMNSLRDYIKSLDMLTKWQNKKLTGNFASQSKLTSGAEQSSNNTDNAMMDKIRAKLLQGRKLTAEEMAYLQQHSPQTYQSVKKLEAEKKEYEKELKKCSTKEEVEKLKMSKISASLSTIRSVSTNPNIPESAKLSIAEAELQRVNSLQKITDDFVKSGDYAKLPTEAEINAEAAEQQAEKEVSDSENVSEKNVANEYVTEETEQVETERKDNPETEKAAQTPESKQTEKDFSHGGKADRSKVKKIYLDNMKKD